MITKLIPNPNIRIPLYIVLFFVVVAIVDGVFVYNAVNSHSGVVTENAYEKGLNYNQAIKQAENAQKFPQNLSINISANSEVEVSYSIAAESNVKQVLILAERPIEKAEKITINFDSKKLIKDNSKLNYSAIIGLPKKGNWDLLVIAKSGDAEYRKKQRIFIE